MSEISDYSDTKVRPLNQVDVERMIAHDIGLLEDVTRDYRDALKDEAEADALYKRKWARVFQAANGAKYMKEAYADENCADEYREKLVTIARSKALYQYLTTIRSRLEGLRSLNTNIRSQV